MQRFLPLLLSLSIILSLTLSLIGSGLAKLPAQPNIVLDGVRDASYTLLADDPASDLANPGPGGWPGTLWTDQTALYTADDGVNLYVYIDLSAYAQDTSSGSIGLVLDTTGDTPASGGSTDPWGNAITFAYSELYHNAGGAPISTTHIVLPDFIVRGNIPGISDPPNQNNGWTEFRQWNGANWNTGQGINWGGISGGGQVGTHVAYANNQGVEFSIPWADLGVTPGSTINLQFFATQTGVAKGAFDTVPSDDQSTGWDDPTTQAHLATFESNFETPTPSATFTAGPSPTWTNTPTSGGSVCDGASTGDNQLVTAEIYHDSTQLLFRDPQGAIPANGSAALRLRTCHDDAQSVEIWVWKTGDPLNAPSFQYAASVAFTDPNGYDFWEYQVPGPGQLIDQWYQFRVVDGTRSGYYHVLSGSNNSGPGDWSDALLNLSWKLPTSVADYTVPSWMQDAVIYQIFPDRFRNGNPSNDPGSSRVVYGPETCGGGTCQWSQHANWNDSPVVSPNYGINYFGGDLQGVIDKLDYLQTLGVNVIYFNPIFEASSNHGYDTNDYYSIRQIFGDETLFGNLITQANSRGMRVILDGVYNHAGSDSKYMDGYGLDRWPSDTGACESASSPYRSWFTPGGNGSGCAGDWKWKGWYGYETIPELIENDAVKNFFYRGASPQSPGGVSVTEYWIDRGIAGWRFDVAQDITLDWWADMRPYVKTQYGSDEVLMLGEVTGGCDWGLYRSYLTKNGLDSVMNYCFRDWTAGFANGGSPSNFDNAFNNFRSQLPRSPFYALMNLISSHDSPRMLNLLNGDKARLKLAVILQMTLPGAPSIYYGDEVALAGGGDADNRRTYPWADLGGSPDANMLEHFTELVGIRNNHPALRGGEVNTLLISDAQNLYSYIRWNENETLVVVLNNGGSMQSAVVPVGSYLSDGAVLTDLLNGGTVTVSNGEINLSVSGLWGAILHIDSAPVATATPTASPTPSQTPTLTQTPGPSPTSTQTFTPGPSPTPTLSATPGPSPTPTSSATPGPSPTATQPGAASSHAFLPLLVRQDIAIQR